MVHMPCRIRYQGEEYTGVTKDASETGISIALPKPYFFEENTDVEIVLDSEDYHVDMFATVVHVSPRDDDWVYSMKITDINGSYDELLGILYDRIPTVPMEIKKDSGGFEDLKLNMQKRVTPPFYQKRNYPRVTIDDRVPCLNEGVSSVRVFDFNYVCLTVEDDDAPENLQLAVKDDIILNCKFESEIRKGLQLYNVVNYREILSSKKNRNELLDWMLEHSGKKNEQEKEAVAKVRSKTGEFNEMELLG